MNKKIGAILIVIALVIGAYLFYFQEKQPIVVEEIINQGVASTSPTTLPETSPTLDKSWQVLEQYLVAAKAHDIAAVENLSYQLSDSCKKIAESEDAKKDCEARMDTVYNFGSQLQKTDFKYIWSDSKQIVLATDWLESDEGDLAARIRSTIYFTRGEDGSLKVLSFKPAQGTFISKFDKKEGGPQIKLTAEEIKARLIKYTEDADKDGVEDYVETCSGTSNNSTCIKTDPKKRDTNRNGWWDGVEALFYK